MRARAGPDMAAPRYWWRRALPAAARVARGQRGLARGGMRRAGRGAQAVAGRFSLLSIPAQTARAHGTYAQRAPCHGAPRTLVRFYTLINLFLFF